MVAAGYGVAYGLDEYLKRFERVVGRVEHVVLLGAILGTIAWLGWRVLRARYHRRAP
jgi:hypothetical protein